MDKRSKFKRKQKLHGAYLANFPLSFVVHALQTLQAIGETRVLGSWAMGIGHRAASYTGSEGQSLRAQT